MLRRGSGIRPPRISLGRPDRPDGRPQLRVGAEHQQHEHRAVDRQVADELGDRAEVEDLGAIEVKGKAEPVQAFALRAIRG